MSVGAVNEIWKAAGSPTLTSGDQNTTAESTVKTLDELLYI